MTVPYRPLIRPLMGLLAAMAALAAMPPALAAPALAALQAQDERVATIGLRLATANVAWCRDRAQLAGWVIGDLATYDSALIAAARQHYGIAEGTSPTLFVAGLVPAGPAARAGVPVGAAIDVPGDVPGDAPGLATATPDHWARVDAADAWARTLSPGSVLRVAGRTVTPVTGCATQWRVEPSPSLRAAADGRLVLVHAGLVDAVGDDGELAAVLAHEMAHNILKHRERLNAAGIARGLAGQFGRNARLTRVTEEEADRLSVWLLARAGFDPAAAVRFWQGPGRRVGGWLVTTHSGRKTRIARLEQEIAAMTAARAADPAARPPLVDAAPSLE